MCISGKYTCCGVCIGFVPMVGETVRSMMVDRKRDAARNRFLPTKESHRPATYLFNTEQFTINLRTVFKQKVLQKLYVSSPLEEKTNEVPTKKSSTKQEKRELERNKSTEAKGTAQIDPECRKVYTVSLPPPEYEESAPEPNEQHEPQESSEEESEGRHSAEKFHRKHKRKRKFKSLVHKDFREKTNTEFQQPAVLQTDILQTLTYSEKPKTEMLTKNRRRKLKKKRHKEKLKAAGLVSKAAAVEFIYQPVEGSNGDVAGAEKAAEVID
ncbi:glutamate-rich protein 1 isoform X1 [Mobula hypostoma]|uniref:glutamate-rich protein 1 isoform X1 n=1 Tax=Mobula hypostoma TaxID=723540 RepID=UPI002FC391DE